MFTGAPLPLSCGVPLSHLLACAAPGAPLGAWIRGRRARVLIYSLRSSSHSRVLASSDLGFLLSRCARVAVRQEQQTRVLSSEAVLQWRALQVAAATPYLPGIERMRALFPRLHATSTGFLVGLQEISPEEVLARCAGEGVRVTGSRVIYCDEADEAILPVLPLPP